MKIKRIMNEEAEFIKKILPSHYKCSPRENGVHCFSNTGIKSEKLWEHIYECIMNKYGERFLEIDHSTCTHHISFTVYLKENINI